MIDIIKGILATVGVALAVLFGLNRYVKKELDEANKEKEDLINNVKQQKSLQDEIKNLSNSDINKRLTSYLRKRN